MSPPPLPQEIFDSITDCVSWHLDDSDTFQLLKSLAVTSREFTHRAQSHLFHTVDFSSSTIARRLEMVEAHPTLFAHVRTVVLRLRSTRPDDERDARRPPGGRGRRILCLHVACVGLATGFCEAHDRFLRSKLPAARIEKRATWTSISPVCRGLLDKAMSGPSLNALYIQGLKDIPLQQISALQGLTKIVLDKFPGFTIESSPEGIEHTPSMSPVHAVVSNSLQWLGCHRSSLLVMWPLLPSFCNIPHISMEISGILEHGAVWNVLGSGGLPRVQSLAITYSNRSNSRTKNPNLISLCASAAESPRSALSSFPRLRYLSITLNAKGDTSEPECQVAVPSFLLRFLAAFISLNPQPSLEVIKIVLSWHVLGMPSGTLPPDAPRMISRDIHNGTWASIDGMLSNRVSFPNLRAVRVIADPGVKSEPHTLGEGWTTGKDKEKFKRLVEEQAKQEMRSVLTQVGARMVVDVGLDKETAMRG